MSCSEPSAQNAYLVEGKLLSSPARAWGGTTRLVAELGLGRLLTLGRTEGLLVATALQQPLDPISQVARATHHQVLGRYQIVQRLFALRPPQPCAVKSIDIRRQLSA